MTDDARIQIWPFDVFATDWTQIAIVVVVAGAVLIGGAVLANEVLRPEPVVVQLPPPPPSGYGYYPYREPFRPRQR